MESVLLRQLRVLEGLVIVLLVVTAALVVNLWFPFIPQRVKVLDAQQINIREKDGTLKAVLSNSEGFSKIGESRRQGVPFSGLMFYNQEGDEEGGLVYSGKAIPGGQDADVTLTFDQYRQDQNIYLHHEEHKDARMRSIDDGLTIISRPDWSQVKESIPSMRPWISYQGKSGMLSGSSLSRKERSAPEGCSWATGAG